MDKETYARIKRAYEITINGCGNNCFECERNICLCDSRQIKHDAKIWIKQKAIERKFYKNNRTKRLSAAKEYYNQNHKVVNPMEARKLPNTLLDMLPDSFDYETAAKIWLVEYHCMCERIKIFMTRGLLTKTRPGLKVICTKTNVGEI